MTTVLVLGAIHETGMKLLRARRDTEVVALKDQDPALSGHIGDADAIIVRMTRIDRDLIARAARLKIVARHGVGHEAVDVAALTERGIPLALAGDVNSGAVAEHTLGLMLAFAKRIVPYDRATREGRFSARDTFAASELAGKTALIVGFGRIGRRVARLCSAFEMRVLAYDPLVSPKAISEAGCEPVVSLADALPLADHVLIHVPKTPGTEGLIGRETLARMRPSACVVNVSRGGLVDEAALADAIREGRIGGACLDVFEPEPPRADNPLFGLDKVVLSPHCAAFTAECAERMAVACVRNVEARFAGALDPALVVNREVLAARETA